MVKEIPQHLDLLGNSIKLNDCVAFPYMNDLKVGIVIKLNPKMIQLKLVGTKHAYGKYNKYPTDIVVLNSQDVTMYLLKAGER
jgi:hypothetical protein